MIVYFAYALIVGSSILMSWRDLKKQKVPLWSLLVFILASVMKQIQNPEMEGFVAAGIIALVMLSCQGIFYLLKQEPAMGTADMILGPVCGLWLHLSDLSIYFIVMGSLAFLLGIVWNILWRMRTFPMVPAIPGGLASILLIRCFLAVNAL